ncbi:NAD(P)-dependent oxidoreductase [Altererythrobacter sp. Root672]|uniref:NAD(P)-dependent oxidoreductase n=1 Tax=Altererythrobacter sp. Root672 TaxID=1736584 RepID=UPI0006F3CE44|nr:NAD(P)-dependent oxidoreductase [Altererythrobacter sp. Root672]KRA80767.1 6-phosphogluconate dehydrogenase [Altererythrobacter sp. Root672]
MSDSNAPSPAPHLALIGFGEAGEGFASAGQWGGRARGWDIKPDRREVMAQYGVETADSASGALEGAGIAISLVTADAALAAAAECAPLLSAGAVWCDMNSIAPDTKQAAAKIVEAAGGRYVDVAVMAPINRDLAVPLLVSGPHGQAAEALLRDIGFTNVRVVGDEIGRASAIKLIRSVMVKGIEALSDECAAAAKAAGVFDEVVASLDASDKKTGWADRIAYNLDRMHLHGARRAAEMEESARTLEALGVEPLMTRNTAERQRRAALRK